VKALGLIVSLLAAIVFGYQFGHQRAVADAAAARLEMEQDFRGALAGWSECISLAEEGARLVGFYRRAALGAGLREDEAAAAERRLFEESVGPR
jgi:hypothetical protein